MHQPTTQPRPSIYYNYKVFQPWLASQHGAQTRHRVVIVGTGPAGMVTALELARHGIPCVLLSTELQFSQGSRAIVFTRRSMEILQQVGVADRMTEGGLPWRYGNSFYRGQRVFRMEAPHDSDDRFYPMLNVQQQYMEEYLHDACAASPLIEVRWGNKVVSVSQRDNHAEVEVDTPEGPYTLESEWVVDASGGRSAIRTGMNLQMEGASYEGFFVIADIRIDLPLPTERLAFFDPEWNPENTILMHREPHGIWRVDYQLPEGETPEEALHPESLKARIDAQLAMIGYAGMSWVTLPLKSGVLSLVENIDKESRDDSKAGACAVHAGIQDGGGAPGASWPSDCCGGQGLGHTQGQPGKLGSQRSQGRFERRGRG